MIIDFLSSASESLNILAAIALLGYMWIRAHFSIKNKVTKLSDKFDELDEYANKKFGKILDKLNKQDMELANKTDNRVEKIDKKE